MESLATTLKGLLGPDGWSVLSFVYWQMLWPLISQPSMHWVYLLSSLLLGSETTKVLTHSTIPVLVVR